MNSKDKGKYKHKSYGYCSRCGFGSCKHLGKVKTITPRKDERKKKSLVGWMCEHNFKDFHWELTPVGCPKAIIIPWVYFHKQDGDIKVRITIEELK